MRRTQVRRSERTDAVTPSCAKGGGSGPGGALATLACLGYSRRGPVERPRYLAMATIRVQQSHTLGRDRALDALRSFEASLAKYKVKFIWERSGAKIDGIGVKGTLAVTEADATVTIEIGWAAKAVGVDAGRLEQSVQRRMREALADTPKPAA